MKRFLMRLELWVCSMIWASLGQADEAPPSLAEVQALVRSNLVGVTAAEMDRASVQGLLQQLGSRVTLLTNRPSPTASAAASNLIAAARIFDGSAGYIRIAGVEAGLDDVFAERLATVTASNTLAGLVLDLRFAGGQDWREAGRVLDRLMADEQVLLRCESEVHRSTVKTNAFARPVAVLVNPETSGGAAAVAAAVQKLGRGLVLGSGPTAPPALYREFPLSNGQWLRIAAATIQVGELPADLAAGVKPDIDVAVSTEEERRFLEDPFRPATRPGAAPGRPGTNLTALASRALRVTEADLVRLRREGLSVDDVPLRPDRPTVPDAPVVGDPVLARGLDLIKGLAIFQRSQRVR